MKGIQLRAVLGMFFVQFLGSAAIAASPMPEELVNISMGMSVDDLLRARPAIRREGMLGASIDWNAPKYLLHESLPSGGVFSNASFLIVAGKLAAATVVGYPKPGEEAGIRRKLLKECVARWGKTYERRVPEDRMRPGEAVPTLIWAAGETEYVLVLPKRPKKGDTKINPITLQVRSRSEAKKEPWREAVMDAADKKRFFEEHDVVEK